MPRIRTIKPEFWTSEQIAECSPNARLLFVGMWNFCDDQGVHPASYKRLKMEVYPGDSFTEQDISSMIEELIDNDLIYEFSSEGKWYWAVTGWHHQKIERPNNRYPAPIRRPFDDRSANEHRSFDDQSPPEGKVREGKVKESKVREGKGKEETPTASMSSETTPGREADSFLSHWNEQSQATPCKRIVGKRLKALRQRLRDPYWRDNWRRAVEMIRDKPWRLGDNDRKWVANVDWFLRPDTVDKIIEGNDEPKLDKEVWF